MWGALMGFHRVPAVSRAHRASREKGAPPTQAAGSLGGQRWARGTPNSSERTPGTLSCPTPQLSRTLAQRTQALGVGWLPSSLCWAQTGQKDTWSRGR